ncbi:MAG: hypothetical protein Q8Q42_03115 [Nanoarchaeota archaeon]|nr:hypothetical protein [Nanoarchaeota archaeon]
MKLEDNLMITDDVLLRGAALLKGCYAKIDDESISTILLRYNEAEINTHVIDCEKEVGYHINEISEEGIVNRVERITTVPLSWQIPIGGGDDLASWTSSYILRSTKNHLTTILSNYHASMSQNVIGGDVLHTTGVVISFFYEGMGDLVCAAQVVSKAKNIVRSVCDPMESARIELLRSIEKSGNALKFRK